MFENIYFVFLHQAWQNFSEKIFSNDYFEQLIHARLTKIIGPTHKTINDMKFVVEKYFFHFFGNGWVGATLKKSKYRLPRCVGQKFGVVPWISITQVKHYRTTSQVLHVC